MRGACLLAFAFLEAHGHRLARLLADHFDRLDFLLLPAFFRAMATACFCGLPAFISVLMFELIVLCDEPFFRGIITTLF